MSAPAAKPTPAITPEMQAFYEGARRQELRVQRCTGCGALRFPARALCSDCLSGASEWVAVSGRGEIYSFNVMHQVYHPGFAGEVPYVVVLVKLAEGPKMISNIVGIDARAVRIGMPVRVVFEPLSDEVTLPKFAPA